MRFPSIVQAATQARAVTRRFPLALVAGVIAAGVGIWLVDRGGDNTPLLRVFMAAVLGLPLFIALTVTAERRGWTANRRLIASGGAVAALWLFWFASGGWSDVLLVTHFLHVAVAAHLMVAVLPFVGTSSKHAFWQYNRILFLRFLVASLFAIVLWAGLSVALLAIDNLLGIDIEGETYPRLLILIAFVFHPWFFLGGVPDDLAALEGREDYPGGLKVFAQFILIPVVSVYVLILTAYLVRVLVTRTWPSGWIGWLVSSVAAAGTLALLLVHPIRERVDSRWVDAYGRWFYVALLPSIGMLLMAIWQRIGQYGFTERRYFLTILALWLAGIALYYAVTASRNIRMIPVTLCLVALATLAGPWSAYSVSAASQAGRLRSLLLANEMLSEGDLQPPAGTVALEDRREMSAAVRYLLEIHGTASLDRVAAGLRATAELVRAAEPAASVPQGVDDPVAFAVVQRLGVEYVSRWETMPADYIGFFADVAGFPVPVAGYDVLVRVNRLGPVRTPIEGDTLVLELIPRTPALQVTWRNERALVVPLTDLVEQARIVSQTPRRETGPEPLRVDSEAGGLRVRLIVTNLTARERGSELVLESLDAIVIIAGLTR